ncbi:hypothetical protein QF046_002553 [Microbacterium sp. W4I4]|uniref:HNH endonuclease signature motif containing protein n=1 Tax=Microbacterium sp. W4I4 TaxID=3042295 RepID=UPI00278A447E|nr:HNH endonuclease signature motif containing protein [Microbacterium sp. W4I4]MDQ0614912.1 hypothetical protein [Microbacterium sp. W4I4]
MATDALPTLSQHLVLLDEWLETRRQIARLEARAAGLLAQRIAVMDAEVAEAPRYRDTIQRSMIAEYAVAGRVPKGSMDYAFADAHALADFPALSESFAEGRVTGAHVREITRAASVVHEAIATGNVDAGTLTLYEAAALEIAENDTPARTRAAVREVAAALAGVTVTERHKAAEAERCVTSRPVGDGLALLQAVLPEHVVAAIMDRLTQTAKHVIAHPEERRPVFPDDDEADFVEYAERDAITIEDPRTGESAEHEIWLPATADDLEAYWAAIDAARDTDPLTDPNSAAITHVPDDPRTMDQMRADLLTDLLLASDPSAVFGEGLGNITGHVQVTISATTLVGEDDKPAQLDNEGPLHPDVARRLAGRATLWTRLFLDATGVVTQTDSYTPTAAMVRHLRARDQHCRFPGCRVPARRCDLDHTWDHALGGPTSLDNLADLCHSHHPLKHPSIPDAHRWTARQLPDRTIEWTTPQGRVHTDPPPRRVMFIPTPEVARQTTLPEPACPF